VNTKEIHKTLNALTKSFWFWVIIVIVFGYNIGKDAALRDNRANARVTATAYDNAVTEITDVQLGKPDV